MRTMSPSMSVPPATIGRYDKRTPAFSDTPQSSVKPADTKSMLSPAWVPSMVDRAPWRYRKSTEAKKCVTIGNIYR